MKKVYSIYIDDTLIQKLKEFILNRYGTRYKTISKTIEEATENYLKNPPLSLEEQVEELRKENELLKKEIEKLNPSSLKDLFSSIDKVLSFYNKTSQVNETTPINKTNENLPSF